MVFGFALLSKRFRSRFRFCFGRGNFSGYIPGLIRHGNRQMSFRKNRYAWLFFVHVGIATTYYSDRMACSCIRNYVFIAVAFTSVSRRSVPHRTALGGAPHTWVVRSPLCWDGCGQPRHPVERLHAGPLERVVLEDLGGVVDRVVHPDRPTPGVPCRD